MFAQQGRYSKKLKDDGGVLTSEPVKQEKKTFTEVFEEQFPYYLMCGMTYEQYWDGDPTLVKYYREKHKLEIEQRNQELWLQGLYNFNAFSTALSNIHFDGKHHHINKYLDKPIDLFEKTEREQEIEVEKARAKVIEHFTALKRAWDKKKG